MTDYGDPDREHIDRMHAENRAALARIEADGKQSLLETKRCLRLLLGEDQPSTGLVSRVERLEDFSKSIRDERKGLKGWVGKVLGGLIGAGAMAWWQKVTGSHP